MSGSKRPCDHLGPTHGLTYARPYVTGWKCDRHTPNALAGRPETPPGPGWPPTAYLYAQPATDAQEQDDDNSDPAETDPSGPGQPARQPRADPRGGPAGE